MNRFWLIFRLIVLVPATIFGFLMAWMGIGFGGLSVWSILMAALFALAPLSALFWAIIDFRRKSRVQSFEVKIS